MLTEFVTGIHPNVDIHVKYIDGKELPTDESDIEKWLYELYAQKDKYLTDYYSSYKSVDEVFGCGTGIVIKNNTKLTLIYSIIHYTSIILFTTFLFIIDKGIIFYLTFYLFIILINFSHLYIHFNRS